MASKWKQANNNNKDGDAGRRKRLRKQAQRENGNRPMEWVGGILYFKGSGTAVPGIPHMPKPGRQARGRAANPVRKVKVSSDGRIGLGHRGDPYGGVFKGSGSGNGMVW